VKAARSTLLLNSAWTGGALTGLAGLLVFGFGTNNPNSLRWACVLGVVTILGVAWIWNGARILFTPLTCAVLAFVAYVGLSLLWSADWREGVMTLQATSLLAALLIGLSFLDRFMMARCVAITACAASILSLSISLTNPAVNGGLGNENFQAEFLVLLVPLCLMGFFVFEGTIGWLCATIATVTAAQLFVVTPSDAKWAGLAGLSLFALRLGWKRCAFLALFGLSAAWLLFEHVQRIHASIIHRAELAYGTFQIFLDSPIFGAGAGSFNYLYPSFQDAHAKLFPGRALYNVTLFAGATHNEFIQSLAIFGAVGSFLACLVLYVLLKNREHDPVANLSLVALSMLGGLSLVGFPMQNPSTAILAVVALGLVAKPWDTAVAWDCRRFWHIVRKGNPGGTVVRGWPSLGQV
jgi:hypothetical protein